MLGIKGIGGYCPCRNCKIKGVRNITAKSKQYYATLVTPDVPNQTRPDVDPRNLEMRRHSDFDNVLKRIAMEPRLTVKKFIAIYHGIREAPALICVGSIDNARSIAWDWTHLFCENIIPKLHELWTRRFKHLTSGHFDYVISPADWKHIGKETARAVKNIPASFVRVLGTIGEKASGFTAESWAFWFMYVAPIVLKDRFPKKRYYKHMLALVKIMKATLKYDITHGDIDELEEHIFQWVEQYERCVVRLFSCRFNLPCIQVLLPIRRRSSACLHVAHSRPASSRIRHPLLWPRMDYMGFLHQTLCRHAASSCEIARPSVDQPEQPKPSPCLSWPTVCQV
jgi:hypothetical protein